MTDRTITANTVAGIHFSLKLDDGQTVDSTEGHEPLLYLHGHHNLAPGLEEALEGKSAGAKFDVTVPPEKGFGEHRPDGMQVVPREAFPDEIEVGMQFGFQDESGNVLPGWIQDIQDDGVHIDLNHPLAGQTLHFSVEVTEVRDASEQELENGHPDGLDEPE